MAKICTIEKGGLFLMSTSTGFLDWTEKWEDAMFYGSERAAKADKDYMGLGLASVVTYKVEQPVRIETTITTEEVPYCIYIIAERHENQCEKSHCKIGISKDPVGRVAQLQTGHPVKLGLEGWFVVPNETIARQEEKNLHHTFSSKRVRENGEWFELDDELREFIRESHHHNKHFVRYLS